MSRERNAFKKEVGALQAKIKGDRENIENWGFLGLEKPLPSKAQIARDRIF